MKSASYLGCWLLLLARAAAYTLVTSVTPVQKVLQMMGEMKVKAEKMMADEAETFRKYANWADNQQAEQGFEIKTGKRQISKLTASIEEANLDVAKLGKQIAAISKENDRMEAEMKDASALRNKERDSFMKTSQNLAESVDALARAIDTVASGNQDKAQAAGLLQRMAA